MKKDILGKNRVYFENADAYISPVITVAVFSAFFVHGNGC